MSLEEELSKAFGQLAAQPVETPLVVTTSEPIAPIVAPAAPAAPVEPPKVEPAPVVAPVVEAPEVNPDALVENWDVIPSAESVVTQAPAADFSDIAKVLGLGEVKAKEDIVNAVTALKIKAEAQSKDVSVLPEDLAKAVDIAKQGGNYLDYLKVASVDWSKADPVILFQDWVFDRSAKQGKTAEEVEAYLEKIDDFEKEIRGVELQNQYIQFQTRQKQDIENQVKFEKQERDAAARRAIESTDSVLGFKISPSQKEELFSEFSISPVGRALLAQTGGDYKKAVERLALMKYGDKMDAVRRKQIEALSKRSLLKELNNPNITAPGQVAGNVNTTPLNPIDVYFSELKQKTGL